MACSDAGSTGVRCHERVRPDTTLPSPEIHLTLAAGRSMRRIPTGDDTQPLDELLLFLNRWHHAGTGTLSECLTSLGPGGGRGWNQRQYTLLSASHQVDRPWAPRRAKTTSGLRVLSANSLGDERRSTRDTVDVKTDVL
ncbi:hypothetical protein LSAT2_018985 [Lamellibrachia satsuma]|nr:hypothetical protein LSAT2_018985 [Lamellibrachia satsuma]